MNRLTVVGMLSLLLCMGTQACGARVKPEAAKELLCQGEAAGGPEASESRRRAEQNEFFTFATQLLGSPSRCNMTWKKSEDGLSSELVYTFADGSTLRFETLPPETSLVRLMTAQGFPDEAAARGMLERNVKQVGFAPAWDKPPETRTETDGTAVHTFWDPDEGLNAAADLIFRGNTLVGIGIHLAL